MGESSLSPGHLLFPWRTQAQCFGPQAASPSRSLREPVIAGLYDDKREPISASMEEESSPCETGPGEEANAWIMNPRRPQT